MATDSYDRIPDWDQINKAWDEINYVAERPLAGNEIRKNAAAWVKAFEAATARENGRIEALKNFKRGGPGWRLR